MATTKKTVQIIARYTIKANGFICYLVRSSDGKEKYCTTLNAAGKATGCSCPSHKPCYHMVQLEKIEQDRRSFAQPATISVKPIETRGTLTRSAATQAATFLMLPSRQAAREKIAAGK